MPVLHSRVPRTNKSSTQRAMSKQLLNKPTYEVTTPSEFCSLSVGKRGLCGQHVLEKGGDQWLPGRWAVRVGRQETNGHVHKLNM